MFRGNGSLITAPAKKKQCNLRMVMMEGNMDTDVIVCNHCGRTFDEAGNYCPYCRTPTPSQQEKDSSALKKKFMYFVIGLAFFCAVMILWLPREM